MKQEKLSEIVARVSYGTSADPAAPENVNDTDFQAGYKAFEEAYHNEAFKEPLVVIGKEWERRGKPHGAEASFQNFKRGVWAATFRSLEK